MSEAGVSPGDGASSSHIARLRLTDFRNYDRLSVDLAPGLIVLFGENGSGKTNFLEGVSLLSPGRGMRRAAYGEIARKDGGAGFSIHARLGGAADGVEIASAGGGPVADEARKFRINGAGARSADDVLEWLRIVWLTPAMDALFTGPAGDRRRFLDRLVLSVDPGHGRRALDYEKAMRGRNRLLAEGERNARWFDAIEAQMAETGVAIAAARAELLRLLTGMIDGLPRDGPFPTALLALDGEIESAIGGQAAVEIEERMRRDLANGRERDRAAGRTLTGPHRADLRVTHAAKAMPAELCSTGEQKALLIGIVLAHARLTGEMTRLAPILLLDEIAAHLDAGRRAALFSILELSGAQVFMTGTEAALFSAIEGRAQFHEVRTGRLVAA